MMMNNSHINGFAASHIMNSPLKQQQRGGMMGELSSGNTNSNNVVGGGYSTQ
jgi:hypothetical protein